MDNSWGLGIGDWGFGIGDWAPSVHVEVSEGHKGGSIEFRAGNFAKGELLASVQIAADVKTTQADFILPAEKISDLYIVLNGDVELISWMVE